MLVDSLEQWSYIAVFILSAIPWIELAVVIPIAILMGMSPIPVTILGFLGNWFTVLLVIFLFAKWNRWRAHRKWKREERSEQAETARVEAEHTASTTEEVEAVQVEEAPSKRENRAKHIWERYGLPGLAFISPIITGTHIAAAVAMAFKAPRAWVTIWMTASLVIWTLILTLGAYFGFDALGVTRTDLFE